MPHSVVVIAKANTSYPFRLISEANTDNVILVGKGFGVTLDASMSMASLSKAVSYRKKRTVAKFILDVSRDFFSTCAIMKMLSNKTWNLYFFFLCLYFLLFFLYLK